MRPEDFVQGITDRIIKSSLDEYDNVFRQAGSHPKSDEHGKEIGQFYNNLGDKEKQLFLKIIKQIQIDVVAEFLALLDGSYWLKGQTEDFKLVCLDKPDEQINGDLTDIFLDLNYQKDK